MLKPAFLIVAAALTLGSCGGPKQLGVDHAWVRLPPVAGHPAAAYFELHGGADTATLVAVDTPAAAQAQMHESMTANGMSSMAPLAKVSVPAGETVKFAPGGKHVMLFGLNAAIAPGGKIPLHLRFADGTQLTANADAVAAGAPPPQG